MCFSDYISLAIFFPGITSGKKPIWRCSLDGREVGSILGREDPLERERLPIPVFLPGESQGHTVHAVTKSQTRLSDFHLLRNL